MHYVRSFSLLAAVATGPAQAAFDWQNVRFGGGGGFVDGIVFHPKSEGIAYARTDIGGLYRLNATDDSWTILTDSICTDEGWWVVILIRHIRDFGKLMVCRHSNGVDAVALDPQNDEVVYAAVGLYSTNTT